VLATIKEPERQKDQFVQSNLHDKVEIRNTEMIEEGEEELLELRKKVLENKSKMKKKY